MDIADVIYGADEQVFEGDALVAIADLIDKTARTFGAAEDVIAAGRAKMLAAGRIRIVRNGLTQEWYREERIGENSCMGYVKEHDPAAFDAAVQRGEVRRVDCHKADA